MTAGVGLKPLDVFVLGLRYLRNSQTAEAREAFSQAVQADPSMCDAWLGRLATGEKALDVAAGAYQSVSNLGAALKTAQMTVADLNVVTSMTLGSFALGMPTHTRIHVAIAYAAALAEAQPPQLARADEVITSRSAPTERLHAGLGPAGLRAVGSSGSGAALARRAEL